MVTRLAAYFLNVAAFDVIPVLCCTHEHSGLGFKRLGPNRRIFDAMDLKETHDPVAAFPTSKVDTIVSTPWFR